MKKKLALALIFLSAVALHARYQVWPFLSLTELAQWDTHFYFPSFFYFPYASMLADGQLPWWSPVSMEGIPLYYLMFTHYPPFFPTTIVFFIMAFMNKIFGTNVSVYHLYVITELLLGPALTILLATLIANRLYKSLLAVAFVAGLVAFAGSNVLQVFNALYYRPGILSLVVIYAFILHFQRRTPGTQMFLALTVIYLTLNAFTLYVLYFVMYSAVLFVAGLLIFYRRTATQMFREYAVSLGLSGGTLVLLSAVTAAMGSWLMISYNVDSLFRADTTASFDPLLWSEIVAGRSSKFREFLPQIGWMFFDNGPPFGRADFAGISTLPLLMLGVLAGRGRMRLVFFFCAACMLYLMTVPSMYAVLTNAVQMLEKNRHLGEIMAYGGAHFIFFGAGFGIDALLRKPGERDFKYYWTRGLAMVLMLVVAMFLIFSDNPARQATNIYVWLGLALAVGIGTFGNRHSRWLTRTLATVVVALTLAQMLGYNNKLINSGITDHKNTTTASHFDEAGTDLEFMMTGHYITGNSIIRGGQGYFFGAEEGAPAAHEFNYMLPERLAFLFKNMPYQNAGQIIGNRFPRIRFPVRIYFADTREMALDALRREPLINQAAVLMGAGPPGRVMEIPFSDNPPSVKVEKFGFNELRLTVHSDTDRYLYYADGYDRFWHASVDGRTTEVYPANIVHKVIRVPAGNSEVVFKFDPWPIKLLYVAALLSTVVFVLRFWKNTRQRNIRKEEK